MNRKICGVLVLLIFLINSTSANVFWNIKVIEGQDFHWMAEKSELRDLKTNEQYDLDGTIGEINVNGGDTEIYINSTPLANFDFINGSRLDIFISIEGDILLETLAYNSDYPLLILPISVNGTGFFETLFENTELLENLTMSKLERTSLNDPYAIAEFVYNSTLKITYIWEIETGLLSEKRVLAPSGLELLVTGRRFSVWNCLISI